MSATNGALRIYVTRDAAALGVGAEQTAQAIVAEAARVGEPHAGESQAFLFLEIGDLFGRTVPQSVRFARSEFSIEQTGHIVRLHGTIGHARARDIHFDQGFEPQ